MPERKNKRRLSLTEGKVFIDGVKVIDAEKVSITFTPNVKTSKALGDRTDHSRWIGHTIAVEISRYKTNLWTKEIISEYIKSGKTPECTIQGIQSDKDSDFYDEFGSETVTCTGCVLNGDLKVLELDSSGDFAKETLKFNAIELV